MSAPYWPAPVGSCLFPLSLHCLEQLGPKKKGNTSFSVPLFQSVLTAPVGSPRSCLQMLLLTQCHCLSSDRSLLYHVILKLVSVWQGRNRGFVRRQKAQLQAEEPFSTNTDKNWRIALSLNLTPDIKQFKFI